MYYKIGVDVGGTNTDAVLVTHDNIILAKTKQTTSPDVSTGIENAIHEVLTQSNIDRTAIKYVMLGTTHCTNALVERKDLNKIGSIRIGLPASKGIPIMTNFPDDLRSLFGEHFYMVKGGYEFDGRLINPLDEAEIKECLEQMKGHINSLAITGVFSKISPEQELQVAAWAKEVLGDKVKLSCSYLVGGLGLLERENAAILNAALRGVAEKMVIAFKETVAKMGIEAQLYIGQNDGTLMSLEQVQELPVLTISSGPTNSIRGAGALSGVENGIVIDVGGTTSDGGVLAHFFPRESTQAAQIGGVLTNFRMPDVVAVGIGGGTIVRFKDKKCTLGPDSVGYRLKQKSLAFHGDTLTLSDFFLSEGRLKIDGSLDTDSLKTAIEKHTETDYARALEAVKNGIKDEIEKLVDKLKTDASEIPVVACGGGAFLLPEQIAGASKVIFPDNMEVANAFGACINQIGGEAEKVFNLTSITREEAIENVKQEAINYAINSGANKDTIIVLDINDTPLAYLPKATKIRVKVCGDLV